MAVAISIVVPVYNVGQYLPRFFNSIKRQTFDNYEVILVDDGSTDNSFLLCQNYANEDTRVHTIHQKNQGTAVARNRGVSLAKGKYVYFCDPDDYFEANLLKDNYALAEKFQANLVVFGNSVKCRTGRMIHKNRLKRQFLATKEDLRDAFPEICFNGLVNPVWNKLYLKSSIAKMKFESFRIGEDTLFNIEYVKNLSRVYCNPKIYYHYVHNRPDSAMNQDRFSTVRYQIEENERIKHIIEDWGRKNDPIFQEFIKRMYLRTAIAALRAGKKIKPKQRRALINELIEKGYSKYLTYSWENGLKDNYYVTILRLRHVPLVLKLDSLIYRIVKGKQHE